MMTNNNNITGLIIPNDKLTELTGGYYNACKYAVSEYSLIQIAVSKMMSQELFNPNKYSLLLYDVLTCKVIDVSEVISELTNEFKYVA